MISRSLYLEVMGKVLDAAGVRFFAPVELCDVGRTARHGDKIVTLQSPPAKMFRHMLPTVAVADWLREEFGPLVVTSGYRSAEYNEAVSGAPHSLHVQFNALDLRSVEGASPKAMAAYLETHPHARMMGVGIYPWGVHVDTRAFLGRPAPARWPSRLARAA